MKLLLFLIPFFTLSLQAQEKKIADFLNKDLRWELKNQNPERIERYDTLVVAEPFKIKDGILSITTKHKQTLYSETDSSYLETTIIEKQEIALKQIIKITKDINVIFVTQPDAVKIYENGVETRTGDLYFLQLCCSPRYSEAWAAELLALFEKAGYTIEMEEWYD